MQNHLPAFIVVVPLLAALLTTALWRLDMRICFPLAVIGLAISCASSIGLFSQVLAAGVVEYRLGGWPPPIGIVYRVDHLNGLILVAVAVVALLNLCGTKTMAEREFGDKRGGFYALYLLFTTGLFGILITGDAFNLYVLLEIASLTGYALIGMGGGRAPLSGLNYVFMGTIGASLYLLGIGVLYLMTGSLNMEDIARLIPTISPPHIAMLAFVLCLGGLFIKMALFPLHGWLPNAYGYSPSLVGSLVAPLTTKVMVYVLFRLTLTIFGYDFAFDRTGLRGPILWLAVTAIVMGSWLALSQRRLKKMLAYIAVAEVGYMIGGFWLGNRSGMSGAVLHIVNDAAMTLCVFLAAGAIVHVRHDDRIASLKGLFREMPVTMGALAAGGLSLIGVPPTCGFFSKWYLITGGIAAGNYVFVAALLFSSLITAVLFFRVFEIAFFEPFGMPRSPVGGPAAGAVREAPPEALAALLATAALLVLLGVLSGGIVSRVINEAIPAVVV